MSPTCTSSPRTKNSKRRRSVPSPRTIPRARDRCTNASTALCASSNNIVRPACGDEAVTRPTTPVSVTTGMPERSFTTRLSGGATIGTSSGSPHALGSSARLDDGSFVVTGGVSNLVMTAQSAVDRFTGNVMADRAVRESGGTRMVTLRAQRALHASAALPGSGVLSTGGVAFTPDTTSATLVSPAAEALFLPPL